MDSETSESAERLAALTYSILDCCQRKEEIRAKEYQLTLAEFRCLRLIHENESINNKLIAGRMGLSASRLTRIVNGLVSKGYLNREEEPNDRRNMRLSLSIQGYDFLQYFHSDYVSLHKEVLNAMQPEERAEILLAMINLFTKIDKWVSSGKKVSLEN